MYAQSFKSYSNRFASASILMALLIVFIAPSAFARRVITNFADVVRTTLSANNARQLTVIGHLKGLADDRAIIHVRITQRSTGAVAEGSFVLPVTGSLQSWEIRAGAQGKEEFEAGPVTVTYFVHTTYNDESTDAHQWLTNLDLIKEE